MPAFVCDDSAVDLSADKGQVAYEVNDFMSYALVWKSVAVFDGAIGIYYEYVFGAEMFSYSVCLKLFCFGFEQKSSCGSEVAFKIFGCDSAAVYLSSYAGVFAIIEVVCDI